MIENKSPSRFLNHTDMKKIFCIFFTGIALFFVQACTEKSEETKVLPKPPVAVTPPAGKNLYYVATTGSNAHTAEQAKNAATPWKTIQKAANNISGGSTVLIAGGTYNEKVTLPESCNGTALAPTVFRNKPGEAVILEGNNGGVIWEGLINLKNNAFITLKGIKVQNVYWFGFQIESSTSISIDSCATFNTGASGIYVKLSTEATITNNNIRKACQRTFREPNGNGTQEDITLTGVSKFKVSNNEVWDSTVSGAAGGEGIDAKGGSFEGEISNNYIHDIVPLGIYLDAGSKESYNIRIFGNRLERTGGLSVAGELGGYAHDIFFYNNLVRESSNCGIIFQDIGKGRFSNVYVVNNTFYNNARVGFAGDVGSYTQNQANANNVIRNNIFYNKTPNSRFSIWHNYAAGHVISHNLYYDFKVSNNSSNSFNQSSLTATDVVLDPLFSNVDMGDFSLKAASPAINKGTVITLPNSSTLLFTTDLKSKTRGTSNWDMGAYEF